MSNIEMRDKLDSTSRGGFTPGVPLSLVSICLDKGTRELVKLFVESFPMVRLRTESDEFRIGEDDSISDWIGHPPPDICLVDFDKDPGNATIVTEKIHASAPQTAIFAVSAQPQSELIIQAMRSGCSEYLTKPIDREQLLDAVARVAARKRGKKEQYNAELMTFIGAKGGCGVTTLLTQLGVLLASSCSKKTLLVDLHPNFGDSALYLGLTKYRYNSFDLMENTDRLDAELLQRLVAHHPSGLDLVPAAEEIVPAGHFSPDAVAQTFIFLRTTYEYILVDIPPGLNDQNLEFIRNSDHIYIITVAEVSALRNVARYIDYLSRKEIAQERIRVVLNRHHKRDFITDAQIERVIRRKIFWKVPNQYSLVVKTITGGDSIAQLSRSEVMRNLKEWAEAIGVKPGVESKKKESRGILGIWDG
jgi:pilus assembly protein CpaE